MKVPSRMVALMGLVFGLSTGAVVSEGAWAWPQSPGPGQFDAKESCIMVYIKQQSSDPNLYVACDGERVFATVAPNFVDVGDQPTYLSSLKSSFIAMVDSKGVKKCAEYDDAGVWWSFCSSK